MTMQPPAERGGTAAGQTGPILGIFAHPDDEAFSCAGTFAAAHDLSVPVSVISATRGEAGEISDPALATPETLGTVREGELRAAMAALGVRDVRFLGYRDSGMAGTPENRAPGAFMQVPAAEVVGRLVALIRAMRPQTVITFGPEGLYGHPDHLAVHRTATAAVVAAADPESGEPGAPWRVWALYQTAVPRERVRELAARGEGPFKDMTPEDLATFGTPRDEITTVIDVTPYLADKLAALRAHRTQFAESGPLADLLQAEVERFLAREHFVRVPLPWQDPAALPRDLLSELATATPAEAY